jgi:hypothetical protein
VGQKFTLFIQRITVEPLVPDPRPFEVKIAITKLKRYKYPGSDQIAAELIQAGGETLRYKIHKLITSIWKKEEFPEQWKEFIDVPFTRRAIKVIVVIIVRYHCY